MFPRNPQVNGALPGTLLAVHSADSGASQGAALLGRQVGVGHPQFTLIHGQLGGPGTDRAPPQDLLGLHFPAQGGNFSKSPEQAEQEVPGAYTLRPRSEQTDNKHTPLCSEGVEQGPNSVPVPGTSWPCPAPHPSSSLSGHQQINHQPQTLAQLPQRHSHQQW